MKILHINSYYSTGKFYKNLYENQIKSGLDINVYLPTPYNFREDIFDYGSYTTISKNHGKYDRLIFHLKHTKIYNDILSKFEINKYDIIHAHSLFSNGYIAYKLHMKSNIPYVVAVRNTDVNLFFSKMVHLRSLGVNILKNANAIIFISEPYKNYTIESFIPEKHKKEIKGKSIIIPNGIDDFWFNNKVEDKIKPSDKNIRLIYAGGINANKNIETTTKTCELLIKQGYKITYKVIGKVTESKYEGFAKKYSFIQYIPFCQKEELIEHHRASDIFVMPSKHETFGLVYAEAMSQGLPVIYTRGQGFDGQFLEGEVGYSVQYNDVNEIANRIIDILENYDNISRSSISKVDKFDWSKIANTYEKIYESFV